MRLKICGATRMDEIVALAAAGVDFVGLWHGVPNGRTELNLDNLTRLAAAATATPHLKPILVTLEPDPDKITEAVTTSNITRIQLHGYQQPAAAKSLKTKNPNTTIIKVLHINAGNECVERPLIRSYQRAGVDVFLLDALAADGQIGSTAQTIDPSAAERIIELCDRPVMLAGGLTASNSARYRQLAGHPRFFGIDVDSGARNADGRIDARRVAEIKDKWTVVGSQ
jgi:phosphoribosylanthranilate isomerase